MSQRTEKKAATTTITTATSTINKSVARRKEMAKLSDKWQTNIKWLCDQHPFCIYHNKRSISNGIWYKSLFDCVHCSLLWNPLFPSPPSTPTHLSPCLFLFLSFATSKYGCRHVCDVFYKIGWQKPIKLLRHLEHTFEQITENHHSPIKQNKAKPNQTKERLFQCKLNTFRIGDFTPSRVPKTPIQKKKHTKMADP